MITLDEMNATEHERQEAAAMVRLIRFARFNALFFNVNYEECSNCWYIDLKGCATGEGFHVRKYGTLARAVAQVIENAQEVAKQQGWKPYDEGKPLND